MRCPCQFRLRTLCLASCLSAAALGVLTPYRDAVLQQRRIVAALEARGARVLYDMDSGFLGEPEITWLRGCGVEDWFYRVESVAFYERPCGDADLELMVALRGLREASLLATHVSDQGVARLAQSRSLLRLRVSGSTLGNEALRGLAAVKSLQQIHIDDSVVTDAGLAELSRMPQLETLVLGKAHVTERGLAALRRALPHCQIVIAGQLIPCNPQPEAERGDNLL
jgi:hypothetical protein